MLFIVRIIRERGERERKWVVVRGTTFEVGARNYISGLKVPRQCPLVLLV
jgi:hypothetical protein